MGIKNKIVLSLLLVFICLNGFSQTSSIIVETSPLPEDPLNVFYNKIIFLDSVQNSSKPIDLFDKNPFNHLAYYTN